MLHLIVTVILASGISYYVPVVFCGVSVEGTETAVVRCLCDFIYRHAAILVFVEDKVAQVLLADHVQYKPFFSRRE